MSCVNNPISVGIVSPTIGNNEKLMLKLVVVRHVVKSGKDKKLQATDNSSSLNGALVETVNTVGTSVEVPDGGFGVGGFVPTNVGEVVTSSLLLEDVVVDLVPQFPVPQ